jgi:anti-sigma factor RsiW
MTTNVGSAASGELTCQELVELITDYLEDTLSASERLRFEAHLRDCDGCTAYLAQMRMTIQMVGRLGEDSISRDAQEALLRAFRRWKGGGPAVGRTSG